MAKKDIRRTLFPFEDNLKRKIKIGGERIVAAFDLIFATRAETDAGIITDKALNPDVGAYAYDRFRYPGQHAAGKGTRSAVIATAGGVAAIDCKRSNVFEVTLTDAETLFANPVNPYSGQVLNLIIRQDATGNRTATFGDAWTFVNRALPLLSLEANKVDLISMQYDGTARKWRCAFMRDFGADGLGKDLLFEVGNIGNGIQIYKDTIDILGTTTSRLRTLLQTAPIKLTQNEDTIVIEFETSTAPEVGYHLVFNGSEWDAAAFPFIPSFLDELSDVAIDVAYLAIGDVLTWDGYNWVAAAPTGGGGGGTGVTDGDKGDIVVSGTGTVWEFDSAVVTAAARTLLDDSTVAAMRTTLELPTIFVQSGTPTANATNDLWFW